MNNFISKDIIQDIQDKMKQDLIVPIIGFNAYCVKNSDQAVVPYLMHHFLLSLKGRLGISDAEIKDYVSACDDVLKGLNQIDMLFKSNNITLGTQLNQFMNRSQEIVNCITLQEDVKNYLINGHFPLIISTSFFHTSLNDYDECYYQKLPHSDGDIVMDRSGKCVPTIYYLFGNARNNALYSEIDFLSYLHCLHDMETRPTKLLTYLSTRYIMLLGCEIPDWTFRFLLYSLKRNSVESPNLSDDNFEGCAINYKMDTELSLFLQKINYLVGEDLKQLLSHLINIVPKKPSIFLSYSEKENSSAYASILNIKEQLSAYFDVWFFPDQRNANVPGTAYWDLIQNGIKSCTYFMPIISSNLCLRIDKNKDIVKGHLDQDDISKDDEWGVLSEWKLALQHYRNLLNTNKMVRYCLPCLIDVSIEDARDMINAHFGNLRDLFLPESGCNFAQYNPNHSLDVQSIYNNLLNQ